MYAFCVLECMLRPPPEKETGGKTHERKSWSLDRLRASGDAAGECGSCRPGAVEQYESADPVVIRECLHAKEEVEKLNEFESPVAILIDELKSKNYTTEDITRELAKQGYGWDPKTGACW
ncbi:MAG TPA: hypothetical protein PK336_05430, partial [Methanoculleus sp.]|nr:hypothetical protein [Methanoculleus sp.]